MESNQTRAYALRESAGWTSRGPHDRSRGTATPVHHPNAPVARAAGARSSG